MNEKYKKRLIELARELHDLQFEATKKYKDYQKVEVPMKEIIINSKVNYLIGYILALEE